MLGWLYVIDNTHNIDILPIRQGHVLVIPKVHYQRLSDLPADIARATGEAVSKVANALTKGAAHPFCAFVTLCSCDIQAMDNTALNVVCNQEYAQAVPHVRDIANC